MTREEMIALLSKVQYSIIWEGASNVGWTEHQLWVNGKGFGYFMCDEPTQSWEGPGVGTEKWALIKEKILNGTIVYGDIKGTSIEDMLDALWLGAYNFEDEDELSFSLAGLAKTDFPAGYFYAMETVDGTHYFGTKGAFQSAYERDWCDESWELMEDEFLEEWIDVLRKENLILPD